MEKQHAFLFVLRHQQEIKFAFGLHDKEKSNSFNCQNERFSKWFNTIGAMIVKFQRTRLTAIGSKTLLKNLSTSFADSLFLSKTGCLPK